MSLGNFVRTRRNCKIYIFPDHTDKYGKPDHSGWKEIRCIPSKKIVEAMGIKEGDVLVVQLKGGELALKRVETKPKIAKSWSKIKPEEVEEVGEEITKRIL